MKTSSCKKAIFLKEKKLFIKKILLVSILFSVGLTAKSQQSLLDKLNKTISGVKKKVDSTNNKLNTLKNKTDSTRASVKSITGNKDSVGNNRTGSNTSINPGTGPRGKDQLDFVVTGCSGNTAAQTVTLYFTISNPVKVNQTINIGMGNAALAIDHDGDQCRPSECRLANGNGASLTELPTGVNMKGSITFNNVLPKETDFATIHFNIFTRNHDGNGDQQTKTIDLKNVVINWE